MIFKKYKLSELCTIKYGKDHKVHNDGEIPVYGTGGIMRHIDDYIYDQESVLIPRKGTLTGIFYVENKFWTVDTLFWTIINKNNVLPKYLYYYLLTIDFNNMNVGSAVPSLTTKLLNEIEIFLPNINEQSKILNILSSIDSKIELNNKINNNLEELAQTLYKHWFVDFEFTNEEGLPYKSSGGKMVESELGLIPEGWNKIKLDKYLEFERGVEPGAKNYNDTKGKNSLAFIRVGDLNKYKPVYVDKKHLKNKYINLDDILVSFDGAIGRVSIGLEGSYSTGLRKIYSNNKINLPKEYIYYLFKSEKIQNTINNHANGTTILHASSSIKFLETVYNEEIIEKFSKIVNPLFSKIIHIINENQKLANLRDLLLPKLMSGEIRVPIKE